MARILRGIALIGMVFILAGCFRQAEEPLDEVTLESPTSDGAALATLPPVDSNGLAATNTPPMIVTVAVTNTLQVTETGSGIQVILPTDTPAQLFVTPGSPLGTQIIVTNTATLGTPPSPLPGLITPTDFLNNDDGENINSACEYTVQSGDSLFRIAINNDTTVAAIQAANDMTTDTIFPGDILIIPDCGADSSDSSGDPEAVETPGASSTALPDGYQLHTVSSGEVLGSIAERYGVPQSAIIAENNLTNPNSLSVGQELIIPPPQ